MRNSSRAAAQPKHPLSYKNLWFRFVWAIKYFYFFLVGAAECLYILRIFWNYTWKTKKRKNARIADLENLPGAEVKHLSTILVQGVLVEPRGVNKSRSQPIAARESGERCKLSSGVWGRAPAANDFVAY